MNKNDSFSRYQDPNRGGQNAGMNELIQAENRNLDINPDRYETPITRFQSSQFENIDGRLMADASELQKNAGDQIEVIYPNGDILRYSLNKTYRDRENEILYWEYTSRQSRFKIAIFND